MKQLYTYNLQFGAARSFLVYPRVSDREDVMGQFRLAGAVPVEVGCGMWFVELLEAGKLRRDIGDRLLGRVVGEMAL